MNRIFGTKKAAPPPPTLSDASSKIDARTAALDEKIRKLDDELRRYHQQMKKAKGPAATTLKKRALDTLKRKKMYEQQRDQLAAQRDQKEMGRGGGGAHTRPSWPGWPHAPTRGSRGSWSAVGLEAAWTAPAAASTAAPAAAGPLVAPRSSNGASATVAQRVFRDGQLDWPRSIRRRETGGSNE